VGAPHAKLKDFAHASEAEIRVERPARTRIFDYKRKLAQRHELGREDITVPRLELQLGARSLNLHDQRIAFLNIAQLR
jgi:hypothetical protein